MMKAKPGDVDPLPSVSRRRPRQARARQTVDALVAAAAEVFDAEGFDGATTDAIVRRAGVSVGSMYQYFPDKEALLLAVGQRLRDDCASLHAAFLAELAAGPPLAAGVDAFVDYLVASHAGSRRLRCLLFEDRHPPVEPLRRLHTTTVDALEAWLTGRVLHPDRVARLLERAVSTLVHNAVLHPADDLPPEHAVAEVRRLARAYVEAG